MSTANETGAPEQPRPTDWFEEVARNVAERIAKWEEWEKSPALKDSERVLQGKRESGETR